MTQYKRLHARLCVGIVYVGPYVYICVYVGPYVYVHVYG